MSFSSAFPISKCFFEEAVLEFRKSIHYVNANSEYIWKSFEVLAFFDNFGAIYNVVDYLFLVFTKFQVLHVSMDKYLQGLFVLANDPAAEVQNLVSYIEL